MKITEEFLDQIIGIPICVVDQKSQIILYVNQVLIENAPYVAIGKLNPFDSGIASQKEICFEQCENALLLILEFHSQTEQIGNLLTYAELENEERIHTLEQLAEEIRKRLVTITGMAYMTQNRGKTKEDSNKYLKRMNEASGALLELISEIVDVAEIENGKTHLKLEELSLTEMFRQLCNQIESQFHAEHAPVSFSLYNVLHDKIISDQERLCNVFRGVMLYYLEYTPRNGKIDIRLEEQTETDSYSVYVLTIDDGGTGNHDGYMESVLTPFCMEHGDFRDTNNEIGIGLLLSRILLNLFCGTVKVHSSKWEGTNVAMKIPFMLGTTEKPNQKEFDEMFSERKEEGENQETLDGKRILLVEDNEINAGIAQMILESTGAVIEWVQDGIEATEALTSSKQNEFSLILLDINMPRMNGYQTIQWIRQSERADIKELQVIAMTAEDASTESEKILNSGMDSFVEKPFELSTFIKAFEEGKRNQDGRNT